VFRFSVQPFPETFLILKRIKRDMKNVHWASCKVPLFLSDFNETSFPTDFRKIF